MTSAANPLVPMRAIVHMHSLFPIWVLFLTLLFPKFVLAQNKPLSQQYVGFFPSILLEPYDTVKAIEVNTLPVIYEFRWGVQNAKGVQVRPIVNYRFLKDGNGISHFGGTVLMNWYLISMVGEDFWLKPQLGSFYTYTYNRLDKVQTMTLGIEVGTLMIISNHFSLSFNLQPGINYYPDPFSRSLTETKNGVKPHFGLVFHVGYNF